MADFLAVSAQEIADYPDSDPNRWRDYWGRTFPFKHEAD